MSIERGSIGKANTTALQGSSQRMEGISKSMNTSDGTVGITKNSPEKGINTMRYAFGNGSFGRIKSEAPKINLGRGSVGTLRTGSPTVKESVKINFGRYTFGKIKTDAPVFRTQTPAPIEIVRNIITTLPKMSPENRVVRNKLQSPIRPEFRYFGQAILRPQTSEQALPRMESQIRQLSKPSVKPELSAVRSKQKPRTATEDLAIKSIQEKLIKLIQAEKRLKTDNHTGAQKEITPAVVLKNDVQRKEKMKTLQAMIRRAKMKNEIERIMEEKKKKEEQLNKKKETKMQMVRDSSVDKNRESFLINLAGKVIQRQTAMGRNFITGVRLAMEMPGAIIPGELVSSIRKDNKDGSFQSIKKDFIKAGRLSFGQISSFIEKTLHYHPAVKRNSVSGQQDEVSPFHVADVMSNRIVRAPLLKQLVVGIQNIYDQVRKSATIQQ